MTVYKAIEKEAQAAADLAIALAKGDAVEADTVPIDNGTHKVPSILEKPVPVTKDNIAEYFGNPDYPTKEDICAGKVAANCEKLGSSRRLNVASPGAPLAPGAAPHKVRPQSGREGLHDRFTAPRAARVSKHFGAVIALHEVDFKVYPGCVTALVGDNGAGKSTLIKCGGGHLPHRRRRGPVRRQAHVHIHGPRDASALGIEVVYQDLALADNLDVVQNMFLGREARAAHTLDEVKMEARARDTLQSLSVTTIRSVRQTVAGLSGWPAPVRRRGQGVMWNSRLVILDEPTAALGVAQTRQVLDLVKRLAEQVSAWSSSRTTCTTSSRWRTTSRCCASARTWPSSSAPRRPRSRWSTPSPPGS